MTSNADCRLIRVRLSSKARRLARNLTDFAEAAVIAKPDFLRHNPVHSSPNVPTRRGRNSWRRLWENPPVMVAEDIERIKREYTDKYVVVDSERPELARFRDHVGQVKTVNMSGRALVEFIDYHLNIGWFDIDLDYLKVVDKPAPKVEKPAPPKPDAAPPAKKQAAAAEGGKKLSPLEMARRQGAAKKDGGAAAPSEKPKAAGGKMSVAEMLAAARAEKSGGATAPVAAKETPAAEPEPAAEPTPETPAAAPAAEAKVGIPKVDRSAMSVADMLAYCREHDAK